MIRRSFLPVASLWRTWAHLTRVSDATDDSFPYNDENDWRKPRLLWWDQLYLVSSSPPKRWSCGNFCAMRDLKKLQRIKWRLIRGFCKEQSHCMIKKLINQVKNRGFWLEPCLMQIVRKWICGLNRIQTHGLLVGLKCIVVNFHRVPSCI